MRPLTSNRGEGHLIHGPLTGKAREIKLRSPASPDVLLGTVWLPEWVRYHNTSFRPFTLLIRHRHTVSLSLRSFLGFCRVRVHVDV